MEIYVEIGETVRGHDVFVLQSISMPSNDHLMELLITIDALRRASARRVTAVIPYFGYARQDRKPKPRTPITAKLMANLITQAGADRVLTVDLHAAQIQGFFDIPVDNLSPLPLFSAAIATQYAKNTKLKKPVIVSPDIGGVARARSLASKLEAELAIIDKRRVAPGDSDVMNVIGDVEGRACVIIDDIVDSGRTLASAAEALMDRGASSVEAYVTHGVLTGQAVDCIQSSALDRLVITDTIAHDGLELGPKIQRLSVASLIGRAIACIAGEKSISSLFY
jgi:ribose-phosphate pyrophosphokinase